MMKNDKKQSDVAITSRPYAERKLIIVDRTLQGIKVKSREEQRIVQQEDAEKSKGIGNKILKGLAPWGGLVGVGVLAAAKIYEKMKEEPSADFDMPVMMIGQKEADSLDFPPGHPQDNTIYVGHPLIANVYYPLAEFHRFLFEHKVTEAIYLLMSLGAKTMTVEHETGWSKEFAGNLSLPIPQEEMSVSVSASHKKKKESSILFHATLRGSDKPDLPPESDLFWFPHEATWRQVADGRIKFGLQEFSLVVSYADDFGINANIAAKFADMEIGIGGQFQGLENTRWKIEGVFA